MPNNNDIIHELGRNFIEYAVAVNTDRAIPSAADGLKPVAKRILWSAFENGRSSSKPHVKAARIVGDVMGQYHPHGDTSIYSAMVRLSQDWIMRYPLIDWHGNNGNIAGDGAAAMRYTEARLSKLAEKGLLANIGKRNVDFIPNFDETMEEPVVLPALFPNLLCNPNSGIGVAMACSFLPHNLTEVANAIYDYMDGKEPMLPGPDFPTGGIIINKDSIPAIMKAGHGSVKVRGRYNIEKNNIIFYEIPYGTNSETLLEQIGEACENNKISGIKEIRDESNKKGMRLVIECAKDGNTSYIINKLFAETDLETSISYNQVALVNKTPTELNLKDIIKLYVDNNIECIKKEAEFDLKKNQDRLEIVNGLLIAIEDIDNVIALIKSSENSTVAREALIKKYSLSENQAKAILAMRLSSLAKLEGIELKKEKEDLIKSIEDLKIIVFNEDKRKSILIDRLKALVKEFGDVRRTELTQVSTQKEEKEIEFVEPEKCVVVLTESGLIKRVPSTSFRTQKRNGKGVKTQDDITSMVIRTNTIDNLMVFTNKGKMYKILVDNIPVGTNVSQGIPVGSLASLGVDEVPQIIYSEYRETDAEYITYITKKGVIKRVPLNEYIKAKKKTGLIATATREDDELETACLTKDEQLIIITKKGMGIRISSNEVPISSRTAIGVKGINLAEDDEVLTILPIRHETDNLALFTLNGMGKKIDLKELPVQKRAGKGLKLIKDSEVAAAALVENSDMVLVCGNKSSICISAEEIPQLARNAVGNAIIKDNRILSVSKV